MVITDRYKYVLNGFDYDEMYDLERDPWELANLADDAAHGEMLASLRERLRAWMAGTGDPMLAEWDG